MFDVAIIGGGVIGCATAYKLSRYKLNVCLLEKENDVALGATRANSAIIHAGYDPEPDTMMARLNVEGSKQACELSKKLNVPYKNIGSMVLARRVTDPCSKATGIAEKIQPFPMEAVITQIIIKSRIALVTRVE